MRLQLLLLLSILSTGAYAADMKHDAPPPPPMEAGDTADQPAPAETAAPEGPGVTITKETEQTIEEYRVGGRLYMIKITPKHGKPYYLVDDRGDGKFVRQDSLDNGVRVPRWVIHTW